MIKYIVDIEGNGLLDTVTKIHCLSIRDADTGELKFSCADQPGYMLVSEGLEELEKADEIIGHNLDGYDLPALKKVLGWEYKGKVLDTLVLARLARPNLFEVEILQTKEELGYRQGSHSLEAWGIRLGELKTKLSEEEDKEKVFETWTPEMQDYMNQDTMVNYKLWKHLESFSLDPRAVELEHEFNRIMQQQMANGVQFDVEAAKDLAEELKTDVSKIESWVKDNIQPKIIQLKTKEKIVPFNIGSTQQVAEYFTAKYGWQPSAWTKKNNIKLDGDTLASLPYPEAKIFRDYNDRVKILGFLTEGANAWLKSVKATGRIHGYVNPNGAVTGRVLMSKPNLSQVPSHGAYKGNECRSLFLAKEGYTLVDADASGLELRCLAHYMAAYDGGDYIKTILESDIHTKNQEAAGLATRDQAKTFIYALCYGAGQEKLGSIVLPEGSSEEKKVIGKRLKNKFYENIPALQELTYAVQNAFNSRGYLRGIDGRYLYPRESYKSLNTLLQNAGAVAVKLANIITTRELVKAGIDFQQVAFIHDEIMLEVRLGQEKEAGEILKKSFTESGEVLGFKIPLEGEYKIGKNWSEVH